MPLSARRPGDARELNYKTRAGICIRPVDPETTGYRKPHTANRPGQTCRAALPISRASPPSFYASRRRDIYFCPASSDQASPEMLLQDLCIVPVLFVQIL